MNERIEARKFVQSSCGEFWVNSDRELVLIMQILIIMRIALVIFKDDLNSWSYFWKIPKHLSTENQTRQCKNFNQRDLFDKYRLLITPLNCFIMIFFHPPLLCRKIEDKKMKREEEIPAICFRLETQTQEIFSIFRFFFCL